MRERAGHCGLVNPWIGHVHTRCLSASPQCALQFDSLAYTPYCLMVSVTHGFAYLGDAYYISKILAVYTLC